jgi:hypothetical protein
MIKDVTLQDLHFFIEIQVGTLPRKEKSFSHFFIEIQVGTLPRKEKSFSFLKSTIHSSDNLLLRQQRLQQLFGCRFDWSKTSKTQASLFREG